MCIVKAVMLIKMSPIAMYMGVHPLALAECPPPGTQVRCYGSRPGKLANPHVICAAKKEWASPASEDGGVIVYHGTWVMPSDA